jgi:type IV pilus assembly protein PilQ
MRVDSRKLLAVGVLVLISTLAVNGAASKEPAIVKDVSFSNNGDSLEAKIIASEDSKFTYFELAEPHRLVVDFHGMHNTISFKEKQINAAGVERVRTSLFSDRNRKATRIVFDLKRDVPYRVIEDGEGVVRIVFGRTAKAPANQTAGPAIVPVSLVRPRIPALPVESALLVADPIAEPQLPPVARPAATLPATLAGSSSTTITPSTAATSTSARTSSPVSPTSPLVAAAEPVIRPQQTQVTVVPPTAPQVPGTAPTATPQYSGEIISLDLRDYDIKDFFRLISEISGLNVVLDPNVSGTVTLKLTDVPWDQALDVVLKNYQLGGQLQGNVLRIATNGTLQTEQAQQAALRTAQENAAPLETRTYILNYTKAADVNTTIKGLTTTRGSTIIDARRNALIVTDVPLNFGKLESMIKFIDSPQQQVDIEARLLQANKSFSRDVGNQLGLLIGANGGNILTGVPGNNSPITRTGGIGPIQGNNLPLIANFPAAATSGLSFLVKPGGDVLLDEIITAAEATGTARLISRPHITTQNNVAATIQQGTQIPVQTNVNNTITVQFTSFALQLTVTPQISAAGMILLQVNITNSQPDFARAVNGIPSVASQSATTQVMIPDGGTAVIGGILVDTDSLNIRQVPGLGSLPLIGSLFKETNTVKSTAELMFFITPRIKTIDSISVLAPGVDLTPQPEQPQQR